MINNLTSAFICFLATSSLAVALIIEPPNVGTGLITNPDVLRSYAKEVSMCRANEQTFAVTRYGEDGSFIAINYGDCVSGRDAQNNTARETVFCRSARCFKYTDAKCTSSGIDVPILSYPIITANGTLPLPDILGPDFERLLGANWKCIRPDNPADFIALQPSSYGE